MGHSRLDLSPMQLLVYSLHCPFPTNNGAKMRTAALLRGLAAEGHQVTLAAFTSHREPSDAAPLRALCCAHHLLPLNLPSLTGGADLGRRTRALFSSQAYASGRYASPAMRALLARLLASTRFAAVICDLPYGAANLPAALGGVPLILHTHNVEHDLLRQYARRSVNPAVRLYARLEARRMRHCEQAVARRAAAVLVCSSADQRRFLALAPRTPMLVAPNVVCLSDYAASSGGDDRTLIYPGGMDWLPNRDAVVFFARSVLPRIRQQVPQARLLAAGRNPPPAFARHWRRAAGVEFTGTLPDLRPIIRQAALTIVPLRLGGGTRLKILESAALARAIVSTHLGAEGLTFVPGREIELADTPATLAQAAVALLQDRPRRLALGAAARQRVEQCYGLDQLRQALAQALEFAVGPAAGRAPARLACG
ncbi:MAG: glycosyltransferase [Terriglobales bacterium]